MKKITLTFPEILNDLSEEASEMFRDFAYKAAHEKLFAGHDPDVFYINDIKADIEIEVGLNEEDEMFTEDVELSSLDFEELNESDTPNLINKQDYRSDGDEYFDRNLGSDITPEIDKYLKKYGTLKDGIKYYSAKDIRGIFDEESNQGRQNRK